MKTQTNQLVNQPEHLYPIETIVKLKKQIRNLRIVLIIVLAVFAIVCFSTGTYLDFYKQNTTQTVQVIPVADSTVKALSYEYNKQLCITNIMLSESFSETTYLCPANYPTIGFGHQVKPHDKVPDKIDFYTAYLFLESDFNGCIALARELGYTEDNPKQLAVAHAIFALGIGTVKNIKDFKNNITKYIFYTDKNGNIKQSKSLIESRRFEKEMFEKPL